MQEHQLDFSGRILKNSETQIQISISNIKLNTKVLIYYNGSDFIAVPFNILEIYPIIWTKYIEYDSEQKVIGESDISIVLCPYSMTSCAIQGNMLISKYIENNVIVLQDDKGELVDIVYGNYKSRQSIKPKRWETKLANFRSVMSMYPDCKILEIAKTKKQLNPMLNLNDYLKTETILFPLSKTFENIYHPKTLVYVIQYKSSKTLEETSKVAIIIGKNSSKKQSSGFNFIESEIYQYFESFEKQIIEKQGYVISALWFVCSSIYPNAKIIDLNHI